MIEPVLKDERFLADVRAAAQEPDRLHLWWLGQSGFLVQWQGEALLLDPYLSDSLTRKYAGTDKPHVRMTARPIAPERLGFVRAVTSTHNHTDHLDAETLLPLMAANPSVQVIVPRANQEFAARRLGAPTERLTPVVADGPAVESGPFRLRAIPAAHERLETDTNGDHLYTGYLVTAGPWTIYHSGDTLLYDGLVERLAAQPIDLALLPINGRDPARGVAGNLNAEEAVGLGVAVRAGLVVPCHYEMFEFNTVSPEGFARLAQAAGLPHRVLRCGERLRLPASRPG